jgi:glycosyltransferase involved in cell wall biosynthesis
VTNPTPTLPFEGEGEYIMKRGFSLIVPVYNETTRLTEGLTEILVFLQGQKGAWELLIIDDGSTVPAEEIVKQDKRMKKDKRVRFIRLAKNQGKGAALSRGVKDGDVLKIYMKLPRQSQTGKADTALLHKHIETGHPQISGDFLNQ